MLTSIHAIVESVIRKKKTAMQVLQKIGIRVSLIVEYTANVASSAKAEQLSPVLESKRIFDERG